MNIAVFGLGYVGTVTAACLAGQGHTVVGVDVNGSKVDRFNRGESPVLEPGVPELLADGLRRGALRATVDTSDAVASTELALLCVGTPSRPNGDIDLTYVEAVAGEVGRALASAPARPYVVVTRSTVLPGTAERVHGILAGSQPAPRPGITVGSNPEFLREGQGVADFLDPELILVGADDEGTAATILGLYDRMEGERRVVPTRVAELVKYVNNSWHATKVAFANEVGVVARSMGVDGRQVMEILCADHKLNISPSYLRPGFAFGGSCLPKDVRALTFAAKSHDVVVPLLGSLLVSNSVHIERLVDLLARQEQRTVGFVGLSFKAGTDDLRESPLVEVVERLSGKGFRCLVHDADVSTANLIGGNRAFIDAELPHLDAMLVPSLSELLTEAGVVVVSRAAEGLVDTLLRRPADQLVVDLVGLDPAVAEAGAYRGVAW